jgi:hypothetical protein
LGLLLVRIDTVPLVERLSAITRLASTAAPPSVPHWHQGAENLCGRRAILVGDRVVPLRYAERCQHLVAKVAEAQEGTPFARRFP